MSTQELDEGVTITVDLANGQYQVTHLLIYTNTQADTCLLFKKEMTHMQNI